MTAPRFTPLLVATALVALTGCVDVTFPEPMPENRRELDHFPPRGKELGPHMFRALRLRGRMRF